ncbi:MAG: type II toxin-antitoxin system RelE/ParE family toxin [Rhodobacteraceae bacterium]|nr:type II toxin-antitoxin system RelE/ParE family toxin [Paracoccaceae bacterium]
MLKHRIFFRRVDRVLGKEAHQVLIDCLTGNPLAGDGVPGTGGVCKLLIATSGRGRRGGTRVVYSHRGIGIPVFLLMIYPKVARKDLTPGERKFLKSLAAVLGKKGKKRK